MRIILVMVEPPLPMGNAAGRWYYVLFRGLVQRGHEVVALATCSDAHDIARAGELFPSPKYNLRCYPVGSGATLVKKALSFLRPMSYLFSYDFRRDFAAEIARGYDVLHMEHLWSAWLEPPSWERAAVNLHYLFSIDLQAKQAASVRQRVIRHSIVRSEGQLLRKLKNIATFTPRLSDTARQMNRDAKIFTIPLGIDTSLYAFNEHDQRAGAPTVGIIGSFNWMPTYSAAQRLLHGLWPKIKERVPEARLMLVGRGADVFADRDSAGVSVLPDVPDALPYFRQLDVMLYAPPIGSGMKVKVLEAFALGTPVVTNDQGIEGLDARDGEHCGIAQDDAGLVDRAIELLQDAERRQRYRIAARKLLESKCSPQTTLDQIERMHRAISGAPTETLVRE